MTGKGEKMKTKKPKQPKKIKILEVDQWTSIGKNITDFTFKNFEIGKVSGGDSEAIRRISGGHAIIKKVDENDNPSKGNVWFRAGKNGKLVCWRENYDSSD